MSITKYTGNVGRVVSSLPCEHVENRRVFSRSMFGRWLGLLDGLKEATDSVAVDLNGNANANTTGGHNHGYGAAGLIPGCVTQQPYGTTGLGVIQRTFAALFGQTNEAELYGRHIPHTLYRRDNAGQLATHGDYGADVAYLAMGGFAVLVGGSGSVGGLDMGFVDPGLYVGFLAGPGDIEATVRITILSLWQEFDATAHLDVHNDGNILDGMASDMPGNLFRQTGATVSLASVEVNSGDEVDLLFEHVPVAPGTWNVHRFRLAIKKQANAPRQGFRILRWTATAERNGT